ncbi:hypothetical protein GCM10010329_69170 [Streptomyces spiroverticillatus]|uniref:Uncharacterized protein n=1 Tax=Streptomyces finlayi TaxID=67296 RepID=A0A919CDS8_9ACTN|nr:DUF5708 family protein [Streptomyces finlayi]GHA36051.1 hypothetical protein GCM10010329_69170 [Streptomyces spiroverticillatus]GHD12474.1 hypothetical protein GCM10010334_69510 [Streptomyces finlayi]
MKQGSKNMLEGVITFAIGLALRLFTDGVETPVVTLTKVGVVLMCVGGVLVAMGLFQAMRSSNPAKGG